MRFDGVPRMLQLLRAGLGQKRRELFVCCRGEAAVSQARKKLKQPSPGLIIMKLAERWKKERAACRRPHSFVIGPG